MKSWTLSNYFKNRPWAQNVIAIVPLCFVLIYLGFFCVDLVNIVGIMNYNDDTVSLVGKEFIHPVDTTPVGDKVYVTFNDITLDGKVTVKEGEKILDVFYIEDSEYKLVLSNDTEVNLSGIDLTTEFDIDIAVNSNTKVLSIYLGKDGSYNLKYPDGREEDVGSVSFLQYAKGIDTYTFNIIYVRVFDKETLHEMMVTSLPEIGYYFDSSHNTLLHNDGKGAMQTFLNESNIATVIIVFIFYTGVIILLSRDKTLNILSKRRISIFYMVVLSILVLVFGLAYFMY